MIGRTHGLLLSLLLGATVASGAYAALRTAQLRSAATKPQLATQAAIEKRSRKLDAWARSLDRALRTRPPKLPAVPRYGPVAVVPVPGAVVLPAAAPSAPAPAPAPAAAPRPRRRTVVSTAPPIVPTTAPGPVTVSPRSGEQLCEALKQAAESQGEAAKQAAEQQCEALKQAGGDG